MRDAVQQPELYCPHLQEVDPKTLQQLFSKVAAVRSQNRELFDFTHRRIEVYETTSGEQRVVSENEVYEQFTQDRLKNFAVIIEGEVGTGKSELCAYLAHRLEDEGRPLLHVNKEDDLMTLLSDRLPEFYREHFGEEMEGAADFKKLRDDIESIPQVVASSAVSNAVLNLSQRGYDVHLDGKQQTEFVDFIQEKLQLLVQEGEYATEITFVTEKEHQKQDFLQIFSNIRAEKAITELNEELWRVVRDRYETASLSEVLQQIGSEFTDTRPVVVFEDFSITAMEANKLASFIESDSTENTWDFIIAGTRDSTEPLHTLTAESRYEFYQTNEPNSQSVLFLDDQTAVDFLRPYLGYFKSFDGSVSYNRDHEAGTFELQHAPSGSRCAECGLCDERFRDLFPFNEQFLQRIYTGMAKHQQSVSPREYIMLVFDVLSAYYEGKIDAPSESEKLRPLVNRVSVADSVFEQAEAFARLARWYGTVNDEEDIVEIDRRFGEAFGLIKTTTSNDELSGGIQVTGNTIVVPSSGLSLETSTDTEDDNSQAADPDPTPKPEIDPVEETFKDKAPLIESWLNAPGEFPQTAQYLERGLEDIIDYLTDGYIIYGGTSLEYNLSSQKLPFVFTTVNELPDEDQIRIDPEEFRLSDLRAVLRYGIEREERARSADPEPLLEKAGTQLTGYAKAWRVKVRENNLEGDRILYQLKARYGFDDFVLAAYSYTVLLDDPWKPLNAETISNRYQSGSYSIDSGIQSWLDDELNHKEYKAVESLLDAAPQLEEMIGELYGVSGSDLDQYRIKQWFDRQSPQEVLSMLGRKYIQNIAARMRFEDRTPVQDIANAAYDVRAGLDDITNRYQNETVSDVASNLSGVEMSRIDQLISKLDTYDVNPDVMEPLKQFNQLEQESVDTVVSAATTAEELYHGTEIETIQAVLASMKISNSTVYQHYRAIPLNSGSGPRNIGHTFREVAEYYVE